MTAVYILFVAKSLVSIYNLKYCLLRVFLGEIELKAGDYHYTFQSDLPADLPSSFEGEYGHIRYRTCVVLDIPMWPDKEFEDPFSVIKTFNLNENPSLTLRVILFLNVFLF